MPCHTHSIQKHKPCCYVRAILLAGLLLVLSPLPAASWYTPHHRFISAAAFAELPEAMQTALEPYQSYLLWGATSPDTVLRDWPNHNWNLHPQAGDNSNAPAYISSLADEIVSRLRQTPTDLPALAEQLGQLSHYLGDLSQPLHSDDSNSLEEDIHIPYERFAYTLANSDLDSNAAGLRLYADIGQAAGEATTQANLFYAAILSNSARSDDFSRVRRITEFSLQQAVENIRNVWATIWYRAFNRTPPIALSLNQHSFRPGDMIQLTLSSLAGQTNQSAGDLYVGLLDDQGDWAFLDSPDHFSRDLRPLTTEFQPGAGDEIHLYNLPLYANATERVFRLYAVIVKPGGDPFIAADHRSKPAVVEFTLAPLPKPAELLLQINDEPYILPADNTQLEKPVGLLLNRWDFVFLGGKRDDPLTPEHEDAYNDLIPGEYTHAMLYLGRDQRARPTFIELNDTPPFDLRLIRMAETEASYPEGIIPQLPMLILNPADYNSRWGTQLPLASKDLANQAVVDIYQQLVRDLSSDIRYQLEYDWSGNFSDLQIQLIDDGPAGGASCTDYLLHLLEANAGICLTGSRLTANDITDYYLFDPAGSTAPVPAELNPFPFRLTTADILDMGYYAVDPPPHIFSCDGSTETGVPTPTRLSKSPDLRPVNQVILPPFYQNQRQP